MKTANELRAIAEAQAAEYLSATRRFIAAALEMAASERRLVISRHIPSELLAELLDAGYTVSEESPGITCATVITW